MGKIKGIGHFQKRHSRIKGFSLWNFAIVLSSSVVVLLLSSQCSFAQEVDTLLFTASADSLALTTELPFTVISSPVAERPIYLIRLLNDPIAPYVGLIVLILLIAWFAANHFCRSVVIHREAVAGTSPAAEYDADLIWNDARAMRGTLKYMTLIGLGGYFLYVAVKGTPSAGYAMEWLNLLVRWSHVVAGVMWIGASFYFIFLENHLNRTEGVREELAGNLWAIHGGGFYFLEKYKVAPPAIPKKLHWFKYEAYFTWLSGFALLFVVYYADARAYLVDPVVADLSSATGIGIGVGTLVLGWILYDILCKSPLIHHQRRFAWVGFVLLTLIAFGLTHLLNSRAAYIHVGALMGTIMAGNVFFVIIPAQKALVRAAITGQPLDATLGKKAGQRSLHNNYITLPVIFIMISNHYPGTFGHEYNWIILMLITAGSAGVKHYWNLIEQGNPRPRILVTSLVVLAFAALLSSPAFEQAAEVSGPVSYNEVQGIMQRRCVQCHSAYPTDEQWRVAPNGVMYDTPEQVAAMADKILIRAVRTQSMPQGNKTGMTPEEREILGRWILQGSTINP